MNKYENMPHRFDPLQLLVKALALKGVFYPGAFIPALDKNPYIRQGKDYTRMPAANALRTKTIAGGVDIRKKDARGRVYFMPVLLESSRGTIELPAAAVSIKGKKKIIETALTGRRGSVKELVSVDDYEISLHGIIISTDGNYPEQAVQQFRDLYELNESVKLICALSDLVLQKEDRIVIKSVDYPAVGAVENAQVISFTATTDSAIELTIE